MPAGPDSPVDRLGRYLEKTALLAATRGLLGWDQETYMPEGAADLRARQLALLSGMVHRRRSSNELRDLIGEAERSAPDERLAAELRELSRDWKQAARVPAELIEELAGTTARARRAWVAARAESDFARFLPWLRRVLDLSRRLASALGGDELDHPYDALLDRYEPYETCAGVRALFDPLREHLSELVRRILDADRRVDSSFLRARYPAAAQEAFAREVVTTLGFDFRRGRLDPTVHPFCGGAGPFDVRLTTRYDERNLADGLFSTIHEAGHGLYEQGLDPERFGWPGGQACSLGVHESQSRLWENAVGRSIGFWRHFLPRAQAAFPGALDRVGLDEFWRAVNEVKPSFIRVDADEVTYHLHVFLRFDLERALLEGSLDAADVPDAWNDGFEQSLGIRPGNDAEGCLQDVHWSAGLVGYFPTYTLGTIYAAQLFAAAGRELGDLDEMFGRGEFTPLLEWLREHVHREGRRFPPRELIERATQAPPSIQPLLDYYLKVSDTC